jgi:hypothetical protein
MASERRRLVAFTVELPTRSGRAMRRAWRTANVTFDRVDRSERSARSQCDEWFSRARASRSRRLRGGRWNA